MKPLQDGKPFHEHWQKFGGLEEAPIDPKINEYYLFHGTSPTAAQAITDSAFRIDLAGTNAGTLYGRGVYFGEACIKADEYGEGAGDDTDEASLQPILVCRTLLGRVQYTHDVYPNTQDLVGNVTGGRFDSVLGDREKCRGTYREFIMYDNAKIYPEFIVWYR